LPPAVDSSFAIALAWSSSEQGVMPPKDKTQRKAAHYDQIVAIDVELLGREEP
jgi:hypothetical protein